jgi:hypothetical protein
VIKGDADRQDCADNHRGGAAMGQRWDLAIAAAAEQPPADLSAAVAEASELIALTTYRFDQVEAKFRSRAARR